MRIHREMKRPLLVAIVLLLACCFGFLIVPANEPPANQPIYTVPQMLAMLQRDRSAWAGKTIRLRAVALVGGGGGLSPADVPPTIILESERRFGPFVRVLYPQPTALVARLNSLPFIGPYGPWAHVQHVAPWAPADYSIMVLPKRICSATFPRFCYDGSLTNAVFPRM